MTGKCFVHRQGPLAETSDVGEKEPISPFPTVMYGFFYQERYHTCAATQSTVGCRFLSSRAKSAFMSFVWL